MNSSTLFVPETGVLNPLDIRLELCDVVPGVVVTCAKQRLNMPPHLFRFRALNGTQKDGGRCERFLPLPLWAAKR